MYIIVFFFFLAEEVFTMNRRGVGHWEGEAGEDTLGIKDSLSAEIEWCENITMLAEWPKVHCLVHEMNRMRRDIWEEK